ncbi:MAG: hypothetical protein M5R40_21990 [Anaerolineae bacterium]|nr:hypothetical protein [Anaerolineae bacterium]
MSNELVRAILAIVVGAHGIGHVLFLLPVLGVVDWGQSTRSWLLSGEGLTKVVGAVIWAVATLGFIAAAIGIFGQQSWWRAVAVVASVISLAGLALFWRNPPTPARDRSGHLRCDCPGCAAGLPVAAIQPRWSVACPGGSKKAGLRCVPGLERLSVICRCQLR